mmetsp:Transcript_50343/g.116218  ORF Transcript_50343/g.116218 Transcript_50343/m.116218 type:complete len:246 (-) Transcript_50343:347-1084(-)
MGRGEPARGGNRGGRDQFEWESVKHDKHRENYIGASVHAAQGRWQNGKDLGWYAKRRKDENLEAIREERQRAKEMEEEMMRARLGLAPQKRNHSGGSSLEKHEVQKLLQRSNDAQADDEEGAAEKGDARFDAERIGGVGSFAAARRAEMSMIRSRMVPEDRLEGSAAASSATSAAAATWQPVTHRGARVDALEQTALDSESSDEGRAQGGGHKEKKRKKEKKEKKEKRHKDKKEHKHKRSRHDSD